MDLGKLLRRRGGRYVRDVYTPGQWRQCIYRSGATHALGDRCVDELSTRSSLGGAMYELS